MKMGMMKMGALQMAAIAAGLASAQDNYYSSRGVSRDSSKPATLTRKAWKQRKRRNSIAKASRKANRK
jgi:hypothetical protein